MFPLTWSRGSTPPAFFMMPDEIELDPEDDEEVLDPWGEPDDADPE